MAERDFPRLENGLIDPKCYEPFLVDPLSRVPPYLPRKVRSDLGPWKDHHLYFSEADWIQRGTPESEKDMLLIDFRAHPYNRLIMRLKKESKVHKAYEETVKPPPRETMVAAMEDYHNLDVIGGSIVGIAIAQNPELFYQYAHESDVIIKASKITGSDRVDIYKDEIQKALTALETPRVIPRSIIDSVLQRTAVSLNSPSLSEIAEERRDSSFIYPVRAKRPRTLFYLSNTVLTQAYPEIYRDVRDPEVITESSGRYAAAA